MNELRKIQEQIAQGHTEKALKTFAKFLQRKDSDYETQIGVLQSTYSAEKRKYNMGILTNAEWRQTVTKINFALLEILKEFEPPSVPPPEKETKTVFISYNHKDAAVADELKKRLRSSGVEVLIDTEKMLAGEGIESFIEKCVRESDVTLSVVSRKSLLSAWVAMESINTFFHEKTSKKKFIAAYVDESFFKRSFTDEALDVIDAEIADIQQTMTKRLERNRGIGDLQNELRRYKNLQNKIDEIVQRLRESLCIDITTKEKLDENYSKIIASVNAD